MRVAVMHKSIACALMLANNIHNGRHLPHFSVQFTLLFSKERAKQNAERIGKIHTE